MPCFLIGKYEIAELGGESEYPLNDLRVGQEKLFNVILVEKIIM